MSENYLKLTKPLLNIREYNNANHLLAKVRSPGKIKKHKKRIAQDIQTFYPDASKDDIEVGFVKGKGYRVHWQRPNQDDRFFKVSFFEGGFPNVAEYEFTAAKDLAIRGAPMVPTHAMHRLTIDGLLQVYHEMTYCDEMLATEQIGKLSQEALIRFIASETEYFRALLGQEGESLMIDIDYKPENMFCTKQGKTLHFDSEFVLTPKQYRSQNPTGNVIQGTPRYMSPEQATGVYDLDISSMLFSFAGIFIELTTGQHPLIKKELDIFTALNDLKIKSPRKRVLKKFDKKVSAEVSKVVKACLEKAKQNRPTLDDLEEICRKFDAANEHPGEDFVANM